MSSLDPLPPALPPAQKPPRLVRARPPSRSRPPPAPPGTVRQMVGRFEKGAPPQAPPGPELGPPRLEPPGACPPLCPCSCHRAQPGLVLMWVPAPQGEEPGSESPAPRPPPPPPTQEGGQAGTRCRPTAQLNGGPARAKGGGPPPAVPPKTPLKPRCGAPPPPSAPSQDPPPPGQPRPASLAPQVPPKSCPLPPPPTPDPPPPPPPKESPPPRGDGPCQGDADGLEPEPWGDRCCRSPKGPGGGIPLMDEPLYQTYREATIRREIQRQTPGAPPSRWDAPPAPPGAPPAPRSTLWQDLPAVQTSGLLRSLPPRERDMQESLFEVLTSEASYQRSLGLLDEHFLGSRELGETLLPRERQALFSSLPRVREVSARFLAALEGRAAEALQMRDVSDVVAAHARRDFAAYVDYVRNQPYQEREYQALMERNGPFAAALRRLEAHPLCQRLPLVSFLLLPFQRITRLKMLLENILRRAEEGSERERSALDALSCVSQIIEECNAEVGRMRQTEELIEIAGCIDFDRLKAVPIISQSRRLEKRGDLAELLPRGSLFGTRPRSVPIHLFLFSDLLLVTQPKSGGRFVVLDYGHRSLVSVAGVPDPPPAPGLGPAFHLTLLENHRGRAAERLCRAPSQSDLHRWLEAFPQPGGPPSHPQEIVYQDWDCPQVQCVESYGARQADELSLEPADVVNVLRRTSEGWCQGLRLADGHKGWFPAAHVREITSEHVRRRNLRERHRLLQAARQLQLEGRPAGKTGSA